MAEIYRHKNIYEKIIELWTNRYSFKIIYSLAKKIDPKKGLVFKAKTRRFRENAVNFLRDFSNLLLS